MEIKNNAGRTAIIRWLRLTARVSAWLLLVTMILLVISGWGITQTGAIYNITFGLIDRRLADAIHRATILPMAVFFLMHLLINIKLSITTHHRYVTWLVNGLLIVVGGFIVGIVTYMEYFRLGG